MRARPPVQRPTKPRSRPNSVYGEAHNTARSRISMVRYSKGVHALFDRPNRRMPTLFGGPLTEIAGEAPAGGFTVAAWSVKLAQMKYGGTRQVMTPPE